MKLFDVIIVGGGPAGLSAALGLVRAHRSVLVIDSRRYRNDGAPAMQNVIAHDGVAPAAWREKARSDLSRYPTFSFTEGFAARVLQRDEATLQQQHPLHKLQLDVQLSNSAIVQVTADGKTSALPAGEDSYLTRRLLLATGVMDILPAIPGFEQAWGDTIHICPYCHGWEHRGTRWGILAPGGPSQPMPPGALGAMGAGFLSMFSPILRSFGRPPLTLFTDGRKVSELGLADEQLKALQANDCQWDERPIQRLKPTHVESTYTSPDPSTPLVPSSSDGLTVELADGSSVDIGMLYIRPPFLHSPLVTQLGLKLKEPFMSVDVDLFGKAASNPLIFVGGDAMNGMASVPNAMASGGVAAAGCSHDLASEDWALALKRAGIEVKAASHGDFAKDVAKMMDKPASKDEAVKAIHGD